MGISALALNCQMLSGITVGVGCPFVLLSGALGLLVLMKHEQFLLRLWSATVDYSVNGQLQLTSEWTNNNRRVLKMLHLTF